MRIGIACYPTYGGSGAAATELGRHLAGRGHAVHIISADRPFRLNLSGYQENLFLHQIPSVKYPVLRGELYTLSCAVKMAQLIEDQNLEILHVHYAVPHAVSGVLARDLLEKKDVRLVTTVHGTDITLVGSQPAFAPVVRMGLNRSDAVIAVSRWLAEETERDFHLERPCEVIYNFVDPEAFNPTGKKCCFRGCIAADGQKVITHISNFRPVKRVTDVIRVFEQVQEKTPAVLLMVGDGPDRDAAHDLSHELGVADKVHFLGLQDDVAGLLAISDLFLFPSQYESFGLAVLEAMASGVPVVCSNGGGLPEVMVQGETGFLCDVGDVGEMARRCLEVLTRADMGERLGAAARRRACQNFNPDIALAAHEELYERLLAERPDATGICL